MSTRLRDVMFRELDELRHEPTQKRIRGMVGGETLVDSTRALLVWEPKRIVPTYAVPIDDVGGTLEPADEPAADPGSVAPPQLDGRPVLDPSIPFAVHTAAGEPVRIRTDGRPVEGFRPADAELADFVVLDFASLDEWYEEDERNYAHPRDPFHRIDIVRSSRDVRVELDGETLAESSRPRLLFEPPLPVRYYLPPEDVRTDLLVPSATRSFCAYKGEASYVSAPGLEDAAWLYPAPLREAAEVTGCFAFFNERVDLVVDGTRLERPVTPWS
jgi:uncharacterized protein (DUF427 family)